MKRIVKILLLVTIMFLDLTTNAFAEELKSEDSSVIVSMGDSYSSGEGIEPFYAQDATIFEKVKNDDWLAHRSKNAWPGMLSLPSLEGTMSDYKDENWYFVATSSATTANIDGKFKKKYYKMMTSRFKSYLQGTTPLAPQINVFENLAKEGKRADYVTITIGGNDVDFTGTVIAAVCSSTYLTPAYLSDKINNTWKNFYEGGIRENICSTYEKIHEAAGEDARIIVAGYPKLLDPNGSMFLFSDEVAQHLNQTVSQFNDAIESIVYDYRIIHGYDIWFASVEEAFQGHGAYSDDPYINPVLIKQAEDINDSDIISSYSIHPNYKGACAYAECVQAKIDELEGIVSESSNTKYNTDLLLSVYDINNSAYNDYTIDITGTYNTGWFGWFKKNYSERIVINDSNSQAITLNANGNYVITITDNKDDSKTYSKNIEISNEYPNKRINFSTNFGVMLETNIYGDYKESDIPDAAAEFNGHYYYVYDIDDVTTWEQAKLYCEEQGGYLATITSREEDEFVYSYLTNNTNYESAYFGFNNRNNEEMWVWDNGEVSSYTNWHIGEPNGGSSDENYAMYYYQFSDGSWNDGDFGNNTVNGGKAFICEWGEYQTGISDNQIQQPIRTTSDERDIVLVLDTSGSMAGTPMEETKKASVNFVDTILEENASIGVVTYESSAEQRSDFSIDKNHLTEIVEDISSGGGTNIESGLSQAKSMLDNSNAKKKIIVLMSDGEPNEGKQSEELIAYADELKKDDIIIYTLGFFENIGVKASAQYLMEHIASDGCHYEVASADDLVFFFEDMADQINGQKYIYVRIACPVDVSVTYNGETLNSSEENQKLRTDFGTLTFEDSEETSSDENDDQIKVLRLKEGVEYDIKIVGTGRGIMNYTIGFMDENGEYSDFRYFEDIKISKQTVIDTVAAPSDKSVLNIDEDGDGKYELKLSAKANEYGKEVKIPYFIYITVGGLLTLIVLFTILRIIKNKKMKDGV